MKNISIETKSLILLSFLESWERFSFFGMRALLVLFLTSQLGFTDAKAYSIYAIFGAIGYVIPIIGGILADKYLGFQKVLIIGAAIMCCGHIAMALCSDEQIFIDIGLAAIAVGTGFFKGNITNLLGTVYKQDDSERERGFAWFYVAINFGAAIASIACGAIGELYGWHYGFGLAGIGMFIGLIVFMKYRSILGTHGMRPNNPVLKNQHMASLSLLIRSIFIAVTIIILAVFVIYYQETMAKYISMLGILVLILLAKNAYSCNKEERLNILALLLLSIFLLAFFAVEMQLASLINLFTERNVNREFMGYIIPASTLQSINPISIIILGAIFAKFFAKINFQHSMHRFGLGLLINVLCFVVLYIGCKEAESGIVGLTYLVISISLMGFAEICLAPLLMSLFTVLSPFKIRGFMMGVLMFGLSYANLAGIVMGKFIAVPKEKIGDAVASLAVYQNGFYHIMLFAVAILALFALLFPFLHREVTRVK